MNLLDAFLLLAVVAGAWGGWQLGLISRSLSWLGLLLGLFVTLRFLPDVLRQFESAGGDWILIAGLSMLIGGAFCGQAFGFMLTDRVRPSFERWPRRADQISGTVIGAVGVLAFAWVTLPAIGAIRGWPEDQYDSSFVVDAIGTVLPDPPGSTAAFRTLVSADQLPEQFVPVQSTPVLNRPPSEVPLDAVTITSVAESIVRVEGRACGKVQDGSGFVVADGLVVTNAHVVAGEGDKLVIDGDGESHDAEAVVYDPVRDLAVMSVPELAAPPLQLGTATEGDLGAVFGYPGGGELRVAPYRIAQIVRAEGRDLYDRVDTQRRVFFVATTLDPGDSGAALIDTSGEVVGIAFAVAPGDDEVAYALDIGELEALLVSAEAAEAVSTQDCV